ncbi:zinc metalloproteinase nas-7-like [Paramacrobiotus metropolitanus]|uniref:zinc metalloproteinase nas-7-like n=1 Tax=Paramacrobiotus metropolitanus TaxID=2943436 RepID=UPI002446003B|nr:zinc metalloproteinase nas-7-like [Paramacrobiotus metropolitanus]
MESFQRAFIVMFAVLIVAWNNFVSAQRARIPQKWNNGIVPYKISDKFSTADKRAILEALPIFDKMTCVRFKPYNQDKPETSYVQFSVGLQCQSAIGRTGGAQIVMLGKNCMDKRSILREMMHVLGFNDEHLRSDRDDYITVNLNNIKQADWLFFEKLTDKELPRFGLPYDFDSVLQRPNNWKVDPAAGPNAVSMFVKKAKSQPLGRVDSLTHLDINKIKAFYECPA